MNTVKFEENLKSIVREIREDLAKVESISSLQFLIDVSGRVHEGELEIAFKIGSTYSTGGIVSGGNLGAVLSEYKRRFGWDQHNTPLCLSFVEA